MVCAEPLDRCPDWVVLAFIHWRHDFLQDLPNENSAVIY
jgi:hypothetical protein